MGHGIAELAVLVRRICKVVCKVAILDKKNPNPCSGFELNFAVTRAGFEPAISTLRV